MKSLLVAINAKLKEKIYEKFAIFFVEQKIRCSVNEQVKFFCLRIQFVAQFLMLYFQQIVIFQYFFDILSSQFKDFYKNFSSSFKLSKSEVAFFSQGISSSCFNKFVTIKNVCQKKHTRMKKCKLDKFSALKTY